MVPRLPLGGPDIASRPFVSTNLDPVSSRAPRPALPGVCNDVPALLAFEAPYLVEKLVKRGVAADEVEAVALFQEVKKYLVLSALHASRAIPMFSRRVDEAWHQFVLFTREYAAFSRTFFGRFVHHHPREATLGMAPSDEEPMALPDFAAHYAALFGELSPLWQDASGLRLSTHLARRRWGKPMVVRRSEHAAELVLLRKPPMVLCAVPFRAEAALTFAIETPAFYLRELPGLGAEERLSLAASLVHLEILDVSP